MHEKHAWQYHVITTGSTLSSPKDEDLEGLLNELGAQGWEVIIIHHYEGSNKVRVVAKKPAHENTRQKRTWPG
jgi:hypothetical protein